MSYEGNKCPCGNKKEPETMLCLECVEAYKDTFDYRVFIDHASEQGQRRYAAITLVTKARGRKSNASSR